MLKNLQILLKPRKGKCRIKEYGKACPKQIAWRGLCVNHYQRINRQGKLNEFALPLQFRVFNEDDYEVAKRPKKGCCRLKDKRVLCKQIIEARGLCKAHYDILRDKARDKGTLDKYALLSKNIVNYQFNPNHKEGACRILDDGAFCTEKIFGRGMCRKHWLYFYRRKLLETFGTESRSGCYFKGSYRAKEKRYDKKRSIKKSF